ncbi:MAG: LamG domain-containing protein [Deltaproteobacteria bacterium]|nr:LamG domain-containing protein [Deltaproteobacteria bacterium]
MKKTIRHSLVAVLLLTSLIGLVCCSSSKQATAPSGSGNGSGYGGGDNIALESARKTVLTTLHLYRDGFEPDDWGDCTGCEISDYYVFNKVRTATEPQKRFAKSLLDETIDHLIEITSTHSVPYELQDAPLLDPAGILPSVAALTQLGPEGPITFHTETVRYLTPVSLLMLLTHELLHKIPHKDEAHPEGYYISDKESVPSFFSAIGGGREALNLAGAMLAMRTAKLLGRTPILFPSENSACYPDDLKSILDSAHYFQLPSSDQLANAKDNGQISQPATTVFNQVDTGEFTISAWVSRDADALAYVTDCSPNCPPRAILSNVDWTNRYAGGVELLLLPNGNFGVYAGTNISVDSGIALTPGSFHHVALIKRSNQLETYVDGIKGNTASSLLNDAQGTIRSFVSAYLGRFGEYGVRPPPSKGFWKGHIAEMRVFPGAISSSIIKALFACANQ